MAVDYIPPINISAPNTQEPLVKYTKPNKNKYYIFALIVIVQIIFGMGYFIFDTTSSQPRIPLVKAKITEELPTKVEYTWRPTIPQSAFIPHQEIGISAKSALAINLDTGKVYYAKNPEQALPMASLTKIMTALLTKENAKADTLYTVSESAASVGENAMNVIAGEQYTAEELLWGLFMHSGNDAAEVLAENVFGDRSLFIKTMNRRGKELGLINTKYINPTGMEDDHTMRTTAIDLAILTKYTVEKYPELLSITKTLNKILPATDTHKSVYLTGEIDLIRTYPGAVGFKTGFTDEAGRCIVTIAENNGQRIMVIVLGSTDRRVDAVKLLDYAFKEEGISIEHEPFW